MLRWCDRRIGQRICDYFRMAQDMVAKCSVQKQLYDGEEDMYFNVIHRVHAPASHAAPPFVLS